MRQRDPHMHVGWLGGWGVPRRVDVREAAWEQLEVRGHSGGLGLRVPGAHPVAALGAQGPDWQEPSLVCQGARTGQEGGMEGRKAAGAPAWTPERLGLFRTVHTHSPRALCAPHASHAGALCCPRPPSPRRENGTQWGQFAPHRG